MARRRSGNGSENVLVVLFWAGCILVGAAYMTVPPAEGGSQEKPSPNPECTNDNWTSGSAFYTIAALCFGFYAYPRGCLIAVRSGRFWRLSPILAAEEMILMLGLFTYSVMKGYRPLTVCYTLLACRLHNGFYLTEIKEVLGLTMDAPPVDDRAEVYRLMARDASLWTSQTQPLLGHATSSITSSDTQSVLNQTSSRNTAAPGVSDLERNDIPRIHIRDKESSIAAPDEGLPDWRMEPQSYLARIDATKASVARRRLEYNRQLFKGLFAYMKGLDAGPSYRIFVWAPMLLQAFKLVTVFFSSESISKTTFTIAWTYFISWLVVELLMITVAYNDLPSGGIEDAAQLGCEWRDLLTAISAEAKFQKYETIPAVVIPSLLIVTLVNVVLTAKLAYDNGFPFIEQYWLAVIVVLCICFVSFVVLCLCMTPICLWFLYGISVGIMRTTKLERLIGKPWILQQPLDDASLYPASAALYGAILAVVAYTGTGPWKDSFPCWTMKTPSFYDWLG